MFTRKALVVAIASAVVGLATFVSTDADARPGDSSQFTKQGNGHNRRPHLQHRPHLPRPDHNRPAARSQFPVSASFCRRHPTFPQCRGQAGGQQTTNQQANGRPHICQRFPNLSICRRQGTNNGGQQGGNNGGQQAGGAVNRICQQRPWLAICRNGQGNTQASFCQRRPWMSICRPNQETSNRPGICRHRPWLPHCRPHADDHRGHCHRHPHHPHCRPIVVTTPVPVPVTTPVAYPVAPAAYPVAPSAPAAYPAAPANPANANCNCLVKEYLQDGSVMFRDVCTNEAAVSPPPQAAEAPQAR